MDDIKDIGEIPVNKKLPDAEPPKPKSRKGFLIFFGTAMFLIFLLFKLPEARIQNLVIAHIRIVTQDQGIAFSAEKVKLGFLLGPSIKFYNVELKALDDDKQTLKIPFLKIRPHLFSLPFALKKASLSADLMDGSIGGVIGASNTEALIDLDLDSLNLASATLLKKFIQVNLNGNLSGMIKLALNTAQPQSSQGKVKLALDGILLPAQSLMGFNLPDIKMTSAKINAVIENGKFTAQEIGFGSSTKTDDIVAQVTGDAQMEAPLERTKLGLKAVFELSPRILQSFPLLEALLAPAKGADGKFSYRFNGPIMSLEPVAGG